LLPRTPSPPHSAAKRTAADTPAEAKQAIDAANATWARLTAAGHADSLAQYYHPNAVILPPEHAAVHGASRSARFFAC